MPSADVGTLNRYGCYDNSGLPISSPGNETKAVKKHQQHAEKLKGQKVVQILRRPGKLPQQDNFLQ